MPEQVITEAVDQADEHFYAVFKAADGLICGVGYTEEAAWAIARAIEWPDDDVNYDIKPCSRELLQLVMAQGGDIAYDDRHGTLVTEREVQQVAAALRPVG